MSTTEPELQDAMLVAQALPAAMGQLSDAQRKALIRKGVHCLLEGIGEDPGRAGLFDTPERMAKAWLEWTSGYAMDPAKVLTQFEDGAEGYRDVVGLSGIPVYSHCEHHLAPFFGTATVGYLPRNKIVGISKLSRVVDIFAKRLQVQERLTVQVAEALQTHLEAKGVGVMLHARHMCMECRGVERQGIVTHTSHFTGDFRSNVRWRQRLAEMDNH